MAKENLEISSSIILININYFDDNVINIIKDVLKVQKWTFFIVYFLYKKHIIYIEYIRRIYDQI